jgi:DNA-binding MarR family transcriptional regulator
MNVLWAIGPVELRDVARLSGASRAAISSALNTLERDGLVTRVRDTGDRRLVRLELTDQGRKALLDAMREQADRERRLFAALDPADRRQLIDLLATLADQDMPRQ